MMKKSLLLVVFFFFLASQHLSADSHHNPDKTFSVEQVTASITMLAGGGGNIAVLAGDDGLLVVDDGLAQHSVALADALRQIGEEDSVQYIVNTHWHGDHAGGNLELGRGVNIVAHDRVRYRLMQSNTIKFFGMQSDPYPEHALPDVTYSENLTLYINGEEIQLLHRGIGHTDGDSVVFFKNANVVHMGDLFFNGFFPFVDVDNQGNVVAMAERVKAMLALIDKDAKIIPGHGPLADRADLEAFHVMLTGTIDEVRAMQAAGLSLAEMQERGLSDRWDDWKGGKLPESAWIGLVAASI